MIPSKELLKDMLIVHNMLIKELTTKTNGGNYLRLAVRNTEDNDRLISAIKDEISKIGRYSATAPELTQSR